MSEAELLRNIIQMAQALGYLVHHQRPAMRQDGQWRSAIQGHAGFLDLVFARGERVIFVECKSTKGTLTAGQLVWFNALQAAGQEVYLWRPAQWFNGTIERILKNAGGQ